MASIRLDVEEWQELRRVAITSVPESERRPCLRTALAAIEATLGSVARSRAEKGDPRSAWVHDCERASCAEMELRVKDFEPNIKTVVLPPNVCPLCRASGFDKLYPCKFCKWTWIPPREAGS